MADKGFRAAAQPGIDRNVILFVDARHHVVDIALDAFRCDAMLRIVRQLLFAAAVGFSQRSRHRSGGLVGVQDDLAVDVARRAADGLDQRGLGTQEAFFVGVEDRHEGALWNVETLAQEVDAD